MFSRSQTLLSWNWRHLRDNLANQLSCFFISWLYYTPYSAVKHRPHAYKFKISGAPAINLSLPSWNQASFRAKRSKDLPITIKKINSNRKRVYIMLTKLIRNSPSDSIMLHNYIWDTVTDATSVSFSPSLWREILQNCTFWKRCSPFWSNSKDQHITSPWKWSIDKLLYEEALRAPSPFRIQTLSKWYPSFVPLLRT